MKESHNKEKILTGPCKHCNSMVAAFPGSAPFLIMRPREGIAELNDGDTGYLLTTGEFVHYRRYCEDQSAKRYKKSGPYVFKGLLPTAVWE